MPCISGRSDSLYVQRVHKQLRSQFLPILLIDAAVFEKCDVTSGCTWKRLGIELANPVLGEDGYA
jgi:hypothetical protein